MPSYFKENNTAEPFDSELRSLQKIVSLQGGGSGGSYAAGGNFQGVGTPEGVVTANKGAHYVDLNTPDRIYNKTTDGTNTGWVF